MIDYNFRRFRFNIMSALVDALTWEEALERICYLARARRSSVVCICNSHMVVEADRDKDLADVLRQAEVVTPDGAPVALVIRRSGFPAQERINGPDLMWKLLRTSEKEQLVISFYGAQASTLEKLNLAILNEFPNLKIGVSISPPFRELSSQEDSFYVDEINQSATSILFVGLGCPKQEKWMQAHRGKVNSVMIGVGAAFDYHSGALKRAPIWMQNCGLEWLHRLCSEPRRLWKRYFFTNTVFIFGMLKNCFRAKIIDL